MAYDPFQPESGLIGNTDVVIRDAIFTNRLDAFDPTKLELHLTVLDKAEGTETTVYFGCGDGWVTNDGGETAVRDDGAERNFHQNTKAGELLASLVKVMGADVDCDKEMRKRAADGLTPQHIGFWKGLDVHIGRAERKGSGEIKDYEVIVIDGYNGTEAGAAGPAKKAAKKAAPAKSKAKDEAAATVGGVTDEIRAKLDEIADASGSHDEFMEAAMAQVPEASTDDAVKAAVADDGAGSIWQDAVDRYNATASA